MAKAVSKVGRPVWAEISTSALKYNLEAIRKFVNPEDEQRATPRLVLSIVKGNGYGHGGPEVAKILEKAGSDWFGVTSAAEGIEVRKAGVKKPILVLTSFWPGEEKNLLKYDLTPVVHRIEQLAQLNRAAAKDDKRDPLSFHLKIDSGMNRLGIASNEIDEFAAQLAKCQSLRLGGVMTHFASSEAFSCFTSGCADARAGRAFFCGAGAAAGARSRSGNCASGEQRGDREPAGDLGRHGAAGRDFVWVSPGLRSAGKA